MQQKLLKDERHELLYRQGFYLPPISCSFVTHKYLDGVENGDFYCPKFPIKVMGCYRPPTKALIVEEVRKLGMNLGVDDANKAPKDWLLHLLGNLNPEHDFFQPGYYPERLQKKPILGQNVGFDFRYKQEKLITAAKDQKIRDLETKLNSLEELMRRLSCDETADTTIATQESAQQFVI